LVVVGSIVVWGLAMVGFGLFSSVAHVRTGLVLSAALAFLAVGGAADILSAAFRSTILQQAAADDVRADCRACSSSWWRAVRDWPMPRTAPRRPSLAPRSPRRAAACWW